MSTESEKLAQSAQAMALIEKYFPAAGDITTIVETCEKLGMNDYDIRHLLRDGKTIFLSRTISDPSNGEKHIILDCSVEVIKNKTGETLLLLDNKSIPDYFAFLNERETALRAAADKKGLAGEIYRENLRLKEEVVRLKEECEHWRFIAERKEK